MKSRAYLVLIEQLLMVLVFALAAALCLQGFAKAGEIAAQTARRDEAVLIAQNAAELLKAGKSPEVLSENSDLTLRIREKATGIPGLCQAEITVMYEEAVLFSLTTGWQEVDG